ncbi:hypothetical protein WJX74_005834 [Apatococcus lobatus]|uniref:Uncharacterized protein n=1 Tax=Apatococcus lobatus TaxID=904363 RepID=A0AAW1Q9P8_9CHLO
MNRAPSCDYDRSDASSYVSDDLAGDLSDDESPASLPSTSVEGPGIPKLALSILDQPSSQQPTIPAIRLPDADVDPSSENGIGIRLSANIPSLALRAANRLHPPGDTSQPSTTATGSTNIMRRAIPMLNLGGSALEAKASHHDKEPLTSRPNVATPQMATASSSGSEASDSDRSSCSEDARSYQQEAQPMHLDLPSSNVQTITIDLLSRAFSLDTASLSSEASSQASGRRRHGTANQTSSAEILESCSERLGLPCGSLQLFRLEEVTSAEGQDQSCSSTNAYALAINGSSFSMQAYEAMLQENADLKANQETGQQQRSADAESKAGSQALANATRQNKQQREEMQRLRDLAEIQRLELDKLRQMLCTADAARLKQVREVEELRSAAGKLHQPSYALQAGRTGALGIAPSGHGDASTSRLTEVFSKLADPQVLQRLESCLRRLDQEPFHG